MSSIPNPPRYVIRFVILEEPNEEDLININDVKLYLGNDRFYEEPEDDN